jgi:hypothetical protein
MTPNPDLVGKRIILDYTSDIYTNLGPGDKGTIKFVDSLRTLHVAWDSGSNLGLIPGVDRYRILEEES